MSFSHIAALGFRAVHTQYASTPTLKVGMLGMTEDGTFFRLAKAGAAMTDPIRGKVNDNTHLTGVTGDSAEAALASAVVVGDMSYTLNDTNTRAADYYKDGYMVDPRANGDGTIRITKSDAGAGTSVKCYVASPFRVANAAGNTVHAYPNPYSNIQNPGSYAAGYEQFAGCINALVTSAYYFWLKVKGPHWVTVTSTWPGAASQDRLAVWHTDGTIRMADEAYNGGTSEQIAGYLIQSGNYGDVLLMMDMW